MQNHDEMEHNKKNTVRKSRYLGTEKLEFAKTLKALVINVSELQNIWEEWRKSLFF